VQRRIDIPRPAGPALGHTEDLLILTSAPRRENAEDVIHHVTVVGIDKAHTAESPAKAGSDGTIPYRISRAICGMPLDCACR